MVYVNKVSKQRVKIVKEYGGYVFFTYLDFPKPYTGNCSKGEFKSEFRLSILETMKHFFKCWTR